MIIGVTGSSGSGKSTLSRIFAEYGAAVLDCDAIYHELLRTDAALLSAIDARFPGTVENGVLLRKKLGQIVFSDPDARADLNRITYRVIEQELKRRLALQPGLAVIDAWALHESGFDRLCDLTVCVVAPRQTQLRRLIARDGISSEYAAARLDAQHSNRYYRDRCDYCIENNSSYADFEKLCLAFLRQIGIMD